MKKTNCFIIFVIALTFTLEAFAQTLAQGEAGDSTSPIFAKRKALPFRKNLSAKQKKLLLPEPADSAKYAAFLGQPGTGLVKLFADLGCEENANILRADAKCLNFVPNSATYSFREREYTTEYLADIRLEKDALVSDGVLAQGIMVALGKIPLENVALDSAGMNFLVGYQPEPKTIAAYRQFVEITKGINSGGFLYKNTLPAAVDTTYALRVIAYRGRFWQAFRGFKINVLDGDERADLTLAFRVVRKSEDGSYILLWKELQRKVAPKLLYEKRKK